MQSTANLSTSLTASSIVASIALCGIATAVVLILRYYLPLRSTPAFLLLPVFFALFLPASIILLVPIDLASHSGTQQKTRAIWLSDTALQIAWRITYWLSFALTWFILPLLGEYVDSGYRSPRERMLYSLRSNGRYQLIYLGCAVTGMVYFFISSGASLSTFKALIMALAYFWGLAIAIYLMGHGLVAIPRELFRNANIGGRLRQLQNKAPRLHERLEESISELDNLEAQVLLLGKRKRGLSRDIQDWIEDLNDLVARPEMPSPLTPQSVRLPPVTDETLISSAIPTVITEQYLATLTRRLRREQHRRTRFIVEWNALVSNAGDLQRILNSRTSKKIDAINPSGTPNSHRRTFISPYMRYLVHAHIFPALRYLAGCLLSLASAAVVWSELTKMISSKISPIPYTVLHPAPTLPGQLSASLWLLYMCAASLISISQAPIWGNRALVSRATYGESATWYATQVAKLTVPLAYNFLTFLPEHLTTKTAFHEFLGSRISLTPLGDTTDALLPASIIIPVAFTLFNLYGRVKSTFGLTIPDPDSDGSGRQGSHMAWCDGADLIERELNARAAPPPPSNARSTPTVWALPSASADTVLLPDSQYGSQRNRVENRDSRGRDIIDDEEESFFEGLAHRVRNTFDTADRPTWLEGFKPPKWIRRDSSDDSTDGGTIGRLFGVGRSEGRVRL